jgi:hypothetical protein
MLSNRTVEVVMNPRVRSVVPTDDYRLHLTFTNGEIGIFDCSHLVDFGVFREFSDIAYFKQACVEHGTVVWPHEQDICPDTLYEDSQRAAPSQETANSNSSSGKTPLIH